MKSNISIVMLSVALLATATLSSCRFEDDDYFDESASLRIEAYNEEAQATLVGSEQGWVMQYFCGTQNSQYEGFNLFAKFYDSGRVLMASDHRYLRDGNAGTYTEDTSLYSLTEEDGPVLAFDTWNDILTVFADPVSSSSAPTTIVNDGVGMNGDYNFIIESYSDEEVLLRGQRYSASVRLVRCEMDWQEYISQTATLKSYITNTSINHYYVTDGVDTMYISGLRNGRMRYAERTTDPVNTDSMACCFTPDGFHLEDAHTVGESSFQDFVLTDDSTMLVTEDGSVQCIALWDSYAATHTDKWIIDETQLSSELSAAYDAIAEALTQYNSKYSIKSLSLGKPRGANFTGLVLDFYQTTSKSSYNDMAVELASDLVSFGQIELSLDDDPTTDNNWSNFISKGATDLTDAVMAFAKLIENTYTFEPDNYFLPTGGTYTSVDGTVTLVVSESGSSSSSL